MPEAAVDAPTCWVSWSRSLTPESVSHLLSAAERTRLGGMANREDAAGYATSRALLRTELARWAEVVPEDVLLASAHCSRCGRDHGRVTARAREGQPLPDVSLSRRSGVVAVALSDGGEVGVDVEAVDGAGFLGFDDVAMHPAEVADDARDRARLWVRKEAVLKATGDGLTVDPRKLRVSAAAEPPRLVEWNDHVWRDNAWMFDITPASTHVGCVCVLGPVRPEITEHPEALAGEA